MKACKITIASLALSSLLLAGCSSMGRDQTIGTVGGAAGGALLGSMVGGGTGRVIATAAGAGLGALAGGEVGKSMDKKRAQQQSQ